MQRQLLLAEGIAGGCRRAAAPARYLWRAPQPPASADPRTECRPPPADPSGGPPAWPRGRWPGRCCRPWRPGPTPMRRWSGSWHAARLQGCPDRALATELAYGAIRQRQLLDGWIDALGKRAGPPSAAETALAAAPGPVPAAVQPADSSLGGGEHHSGTGQAGPAWVAWLRW